MSRNERPKDADGNPHSPTRLPPARTRRLYESFWVQVTVGIVVAVIFGYLRTLDQSVGIQPNRFTIFALQ